ncbi:MAG: response regulator [Vicinamibacterales bacterium]|nr:response regulator [Vicinamibacterales bacterium]MDP6610522.1 response regulator [Vicinamibacterales bacterium]
MTPVDMLVPLSRRYCAGRLPALSPGPETALGLASRHEDVIDLVLTDIVMPGMNGEQMVEVLRRQRPEVKVLYMSGYNDTSVFVDGVPPTLLDKPFTRDVLLGRVRSVLHADDARTRG